MIVLPAERLEARNLIVRKGNFRDSSSLRMMVPTAPVAPTTATDSYTDKISRKNNNCTGCCATLGINRQCGASSA